MLALAVVGVISLFLCLALTPLTRNIFSHAKLLDHPDEHRKLHRIAMPRVGGIAIVLSFLGALGATLLLLPPGVSSVARDGVLLLFLLPATGVVFLTGLVDDLKTLKPWQKLFGQTLAAGIAVSLGGRLTIHDGPVWLSCGISLVWLLVCTNAFNLIDGVDGLATGTALVASAATLIFAILGANLPLTLAAAALTGCLLAFLRYNFPPASIFLGDCGSLSIGFILGCFALSWSQSTGSTTGIIAPLMLLSLPLLDVALAIGRRFLRNTPLFQGDSHHIHHKILARSLSAPKTVFILYGISILTATLSLLFTYSQLRLKWVILLVFATFAITGIASLRYVEFSAALRSILRRSMLRLIKEEIYLEELALALSRADTLDAIWDVACTACQDLQVETLRMKVRDRTFYRAINPSEGTLSWAVNASLGQQGYLDLTRSNTAGQTGLLVAVVEHLQLCISQRDFSAEGSLESQPVFSYQGAA